MGGASKSSGCAPMYLALYVDVPNIIFDEHDKNALSHRFNGDRRPRTQDIFYDELVKIACRVGGVDRTPSIARIYFRAKQFDTVELSEEKRIRSAGFFIRSSSIPKDVDTVLASDMLADSLTHLYGGTPNSTHGIVVVSGDCDYAFPLLRVKEIAQEKKVHFWSRMLTWRGHVKENAFRGVEPEFLYLDDFRAQFLSKRAIV
jgi:hypothetical protein